MRITPSIALAALLLSAALTGCAGGGQAEKTPLTPAERTALYKTAIESARDQEMNEAVPVITAETDDLADFILPMAGISGENAAAYALAISPMNIRAYGIAAVLPAAGKEEEVLEGLNGFLDTQQQNFEQYLPDQYEIAKSARLETLEDGTVVMVLCEGQDAVYDSMVESLSAK